MALSLSRRIAGACVLIGLAVSAQAEPVMSTRNGSDTFIAGPSVTETLDARGDSFIAGQSAVARGVSDGDLHVAGFDVSVSADTGEDLYAAGATVVVRGAIASDLSAAGFRSEEHTSELQSR